MAARLAFWLLAACVAACSNSPDETAGPDASVGGKGGTKADASPGGAGTDGAVGDASWSGAGGSLDATVGCDAGYHRGGAGCVPDETCAGVSCGTCGSCVVNNGVAECECPTGYQFSGGKCVLSPNPCDTTSCATGTACVPEAHCQPLGVCVQICDCSNCGNCGADNSDGKWNDYQEYCGTPMASPATTACTTPCPSGHGCLPYSPPICWPNEGCFSL